MLTISPFNLTTADPLLTSTVTLNQDPALGGPDGQGMLCLCEYIQPLTYSPVWKQIGV